VYIQTIETSGEAVKGEFVGTLKGTHKQPSQTVEVEVNTLGAQTFSVKADKLTKGLTVKLRSVLSMTSYCLLIDSISLACHADLLVALTCFATVFSADERPSAKAEIDYAQEYYSASLGVDGPTGTVRSVSACSAAVPD